MYLCALALYFVGFLFSIQFYYNASVVTTTRLEASYTNDASAITSVVVPIMAKASYTYYVAATVSIASVVGVVVISVASIT